CRAVLKANTPFGEWVVTVAIVASERGEVIVRLSDKVLARGALVLGNDLREYRVGFFHRGDAVAGAGSGTGRSAATSSNRRPGNGRSSATSAGAAAGSATAELHRRTNR